VQVTLSAAHYVYVAPGRDARFDTRVATPGRDVKVAHNSNSVRKSCMPCTKYSCTQDMSLAHTLYANQGAEQQLVEVFTAAWTAGLNTSVKPGPCLYLHHGGWQVGDVVWRAAPGSSGLVQDIVVATEVIHAEGLFNVFTNEGAALPSSLEARYSGGPVRFACTSALVAGCS